VSIAIDSVPMELKEYFWDPFLLLGNIISEPGIKKGIWVQSGMTGGSWITFIIQDQIFLY